MNSFLRKSALVALLGTGLCFSSYAQRGGNFLHFTSTESDRAMVNMDAPQGSFTLEAWVYFNGSSFANAGQYNTILEFGNDADWFGVNGTGELQLYGVLQGGIVPVRTWAHVAYTWDGTTSRLYLDGNQVASSTDAPRQSGLTLGIGYNSGDTGWQGYIDEVMIWNTARSATQIQSDRTNGTSAASPLLLGYFKLDEGSSQVIANQVNGGPSGILGTTGNAETTDPARTNSVINSTRTEGTMASAQLAPNFPNPFSGTTTIPYTLRQSGQVRLRVLDLTGREVVKLVDEVKPAGSYAIPFNAAGLTAGVYVSQLTLDGNTITRRMLVR
ncbi:LamG domain-containing protein [Hymenobacter sp. BT175]|uniref:LamG-like jellyroll fold domain-containing protein n=1 Tax=Hymenobacter translucens TaxID=2886507 RepID=UPI001D0DF6F8|nr:LamG-like jellyroll fold domain-containing protein [Hymenobacter translucens]MCC2546669.1 LamG domain-containing protein [Hymenobacter translucens]